MIASHPEIEVFNAIAGPTPTNLRILLALANLGPEAATKYQIGKISFLERKVVRRALLRLKAYGLVTATGDLPLKWALDLQNPLVIATLDYFRALKLLRRVMLSSIVEVVAP